MILHGIYKDLSEIKAGISLKYLNQKNPIHSFLKKKINKQISALDVFQSLTKKYINNYFNIANPIPFSAVRISDEMPFLDWLEKNSKDVLKSYCIYRQGRLIEALKQIKNIHSDDAIILRSIYFNLLKKKKKIYKELKKIKFKKKYKKEIYLLSKLFFNKKIKKKIIFYKNDAYKNAKESFLKKLSYTKKFNKFGYFYFYDLGFTRNLAKKLKNSQKYLKILNRISSNNIPLTSEVISGYLLCLFLEKNFIELKKFYSEDFILIKKKYIKNFDPEFVNKNVNAKIIGDFNTSKFNGRFYTPDLSKGYGINKEFLKNLNKISKSLKKFFDKKIYLYKNLKRSSNHLWFDYSINNSESRIENHLHTAGYERFNMFTFVIYKKVPKNIVNKNFGNLKIFDKEIPTFNKKINVNTGDLVAFPSYYFHQTVRTNSKVFRETINVDYVIKLENISFNN